MKNSDASRRFTRYEPEVIRGSGSVCRVDAINR